MSCLPEDAKSVLMAGAFVCRHREGVWNSVSAVQFGKQMCIRYGKSKGGLVGISLSSEQVACWILFYHLCQRVSQAFELMFESTDSKGATLTLAIKHKEEGSKRRKLDAADRNIILH